MNDLAILDTPKIYSTLIKKSKEIGFTMNSDKQIGTLLKTLVSSKQKANFLELGTGLGLSLSWMVEGMDLESEIISIDNNPKLIEIAQPYFQTDKRIKIICADAEKWIESYKGNQFDLIFADAWPGKYSQIDTIFNLLKIGGIYVIDDMMVQPNWPNGHEENVNQLISYLENRKDLNLVKINWSTGIVMVTKVL